MYILHEYGTNLAKTIFKWFFLIVILLGFCMFVNSCMSLEEGGKVKHEETKPDKTPNEQMREEFDQ